MRTPHVQNSSRSKPRSLNSPHSIYSDKDSNKAHEIQANFDMMDSSFSEGNIYKDIRNKEINPLLYVHNCLTKKLSKEATMLVFEPLEHDRT